MPLGPQVGLLIYCCTITVVIICTLTVGYVGDGLRRRGGGMFDHLMCVTTNSKLLVCPQYISHPWGETMLGIGQEIAH